MRLYTSTSCDSVAKYQTSGGHRIGLMQSKTISIRCTLSIPPTIIAWTITAFYTTNWNTIHTLHCRALVSVHICLCSETKMMKIRKWSLNWNSQIQPIQDNITENVWKANHVTTTAFTIEGVTSDCSPAWKLHQQYLLLWKLWYLLQHLLLWYSLTTKIAEEHPLGRHFLSQHKPFEYPTLRKNTRLVGTSSYSANIPHCWRFENTRLGSTSFRDANYHKHLIENQKQRLRWIE